MKSLIKSYVECFSNEKVQQVKVINNTYLNYLIKTNLLAKRVVVPELIMDLFKESEVNQILKSSSQILKELNMNCISYYGIETNKIKYFDKNMKINKIKRAYCNTSSWLIKSNIKRKVNKFNRTLNYKINQFNRDELVKALELIKFSDYYNHPVNDLEIEKLCDFYLKNKNKVIIIISKMDNEIVGFMSGIVMNNIAYMIQNNYDPKFTKNYVNDGMYFHFIEYCKGIKINKIDFGNIHVNDVGLENMKAKYTTEIVKSNIITYEK